MIPMGRIKIMTLRLNPSPHEFHSWKILVIIRLQFIYKYLRERLIKEYNDFFLFRRIFIKEYNGSLLLVVFFIQARLLLIIP